MVKSICVLIVALTTTHKVHYTTPITFVKVQILEYALSDIGYLTITPIGYRKGQLSWTSVNTNV